MKNEPIVERCSFESLHAVVPTYDRWSTDRNGISLELVSEGSREHDQSDIEEYVCDVCGEYFTPIKRYDLGALDEAWARAVAHLAVESER